MTEPNLDPETLAAFIDGRLDPARRADVLARLTASEGDLEAFFDAVAASGIAASDAAPELAPRAAPIRSVASGRRLGLRRWGAGLAIAAVLLAGPLVVARWRSTSGAGADAMQALLQSAPGAALPRGWDAQPWSATRGGSVPLASGATRIRLGARMADLALAVRGRDLAAARYATDVAALLDDIPAAAPIAGIYREIARRAAEPPGQAEPLLDEAAAAVRRLPDGALVELGTWLEAARVAAAAHDAAFFRSAVTRSTLGRASSPALIPTAARDAIDGAVRQATSGSPEWGVVEQRLTDVLAALAE